MNPDVKAEWLACLRSSEYRQGKYQLRDLADNFCATGVLMDRASLAGVIAEPIKRDKASGANLFFGWVYDRSATVITQPVADWAGLDAWKSSRIMSMNDKGKTFAEIADYIEREL